jgi:hypothetical protein
LVSWRRRTTATRSARRKATCTSSVGATEPVGRFSDPEFDPGQRASCCAWLVEIHTPRWTVYDALKFNFEMGPELEMIHQERAVSSLIWQDPNWRGTPQKEPV